MNLLKKKYQTEVILKMKEKFGYKNDHQVPKIEKVTLNVGLSRAIKDPNLKSEIEKTFLLITGQKPIRTKAKKSISGFKIRSGQEVGMMVTLRGERMWDFIEKLISVAIPRVRDFRGIEERLFDRKGNLSFPIKEQLVFPEILSDEINAIFGFQVNITTTAQGKKEGIELLRLLGFPIKKEEKVIK